MNKQVYPVNQLRVFINTINDLSAELLLQEAMDDYNRNRYNEKIEEALIEKDQEKFMTYTSLLKELTNEDEDGAQ
ncbi:IDEAL domain-containing protein [Salinicoccus sesuvii]|uniref:IDEAL domain-containing protein n=1 Tax=Salinicoccus sesuvii TaxID=868281 RepID=A0ABV7N4T3_9STAP